MPAVKLKVCCRDTHPGQNVAVVGEWNNWGKSGCVVLDGNEFPTWKTQLCLPENASVEYKYVLVDRESRIYRWEDLPHGLNRELKTGSGDEEVNDGGFGKPVQSESLSRNMGNFHSNASAKKSLGTPPSRDLDEFETALVSMNNDHRSWRLRLSFIREIFCDEEAAMTASFNVLSLDCLVTVSVYLTFLSNGQLACYEDRGHHRPNHHAAEAQQIESRLNELIPNLRDVESDFRCFDKHSRTQWIPYIARSIYPRLPSFASQFTVSVPLTRIRDIAHRGDIPHDLKQEIKHKLQNKLHRCAGPEDLKTCEDLLSRVSQGGYSCDFVHQLRVFYHELKEFFNASSVNEYLQFLSGDAVDTAQQASSLKETARNLLQQKDGFQPAIDQIRLLTKLRATIRDIIASHGKKKESKSIDDRSVEQLSAPTMQKIRLADCVLDSYLFTLLASVSGDVEGSGFQEGHENDHQGDQWRFILDALHLACRNMSMSHVLRLEMDACADELQATVDSLPTKQHHNFWLHRVRAAIARVTRALEQFSSDMAEVYNRRVTPLGHALGVDDRALYVFVEAVIRSNVAFQGSRLADCASSRVRKELGLPPWNSILNGTARGRAVCVERMTDLGHSGQSTSSGIILICRSANGDEDIPSSVNGIVLGRSLPHLSHLAVRARQSNIIFVCSEDVRKFEELWNERVEGEHVVDLVVTPSEGLRSLRNVSRSSDKIDARHVGSKDLTKQKVFEIGKVDVSAGSVLEYSQLMVANSAGKCFNAARLSKVANIHRNFKAPKGLVLPFGIYESEKSKNAEELSKLVTDYQNAWDNCDGEATKCIPDKIRKFVMSQFVVDQNILTKICGSFQRDCKIMVRSSANCEDLEDMSGAGLYDSVANVKAQSPNEICDAVRTVWGSLWTRRAASSRSAHGVDHNAASMAVLVQEMVNSDLSFVAFSVNPANTADRNHIYIEAALGMGETLASGGQEGQPYRMRVRRDDTSATFVDTLASYSHALVPKLQEHGASSDADSCGFEEHNLFAKTVNYSKEKMTTDAEFCMRVSKEIAKVVLTLEKELGGMQDVEGAVQWGSTTGSFEDFDVFVVQARPQLL